MTSGNAQGSRFPPRARNVALFAAGFVLGACTVALAYYPVYWLWPIGDPITITREVVYPKEAGARFGNMAKTGKESELIVLRPGVRGRFIVAEPSFVEIRLFLPHDAWVRDVQTPR